MKGDFTRSTFKADKHYSGVLMQQGRVQLDADWNEQIDITAHRVESETADVVGPCGAPIGKAGFALTGGTMLKISKGRYYVDGILCENEDDNEGGVDLNKQPDLPITALSELITPTPGPNMSLDGLYIAYLDVWQRHITALEDESIREVALYGTDTATRTKTVWQVKLLKISPDSLTSLTCQDEPGEWTNLVGAKKGRLSARAAKIINEKALCTMPPGYQRLENQLYRVEVHSAGKLGTATFKWSRDNGSIVTQWVGQDGNNLIVSSVGFDRVMGFAANQWVELTDDTRDLQGISGTLVRLAHVEGQLTGRPPMVLSMDPEMASSVKLTSDFKNNPKIRRWDSDGALTVATPSDNEGWIKLEDGVEVKFEKDGYYNVGDYWLIPARTLRADVEWPQDTTTTPPQPAALPPAGIDHHYCRLAIVDRTATGFSVREDCRQLFPPLTSLTQFYIVGGDGQEAMPNHPLPQLLQVGLRNGEQPLQNWPVAFTADDDKGGLAKTVDSLKADSAGGSPLPPTITVATNDKGIASCAWLLNPDPKKPSQRVTAKWLDCYGNPVETRAPLYFNANLSVASQVAYDPTKCSNLTGITTVQDAIDELCKLGGKPEEQGIHITGVFTLKDPTVPEGDDPPLVNDDDLPVARFARGIRVTCDGNVSSESVKTRDGTSQSPVCFVTLDLPFSITHGTAPSITIAFTGFQTIILPAVVEVDKPNGKTISWTPTNGKELLDLFNTFPSSKILARLTLKGNFIWAPATATSPIRYLDGEAYGVLNDKANFPHNLRLPSGNRVRGGDFEMWFWLVS